MQHYWYYTRQSFLNGGEQGPFTEQQMLELARLGEIKLDSLLRSPTKTGNQEILAETIPKLAVAINQAEIDSKAKKLAENDQRKRDQNAIALKKREAKATKQELVRRKENEIEGILEIPLQRTNPLTQSDRSTIDFSRSEEYSREYRPISVEKNVPVTTLAPKSLSVLAVSSFLASVPGLCCFPIGIVAIVLGIFGVLEINNPLKRKYGMPIAIPGIILGSFSLLIFLAMIANRPDSSDRNNLVSANNESTKNDPRIVWKCSSYNSTYTQKDDRTWIETYSDSGKFKYELEYKGRTNDYVELFIAGKGELLRLYGDRIEAKQELSWTAFGTGHWDFAGGKINVANQTINEQQNETSNTAEPSRPMVTVVSTSIVSIGEGEFQAIEVLLKNDGPRPIRIADGVYHLFDRNGNLIEDINYGILYVEDDERAVMPGETTKAGGFRIPKSMRVASAKVTITKTLEKQSDSQEVPNTVLQQHDPLNNSGKIVDSLRFIAKKIDTKNNSDEIFLYYTEGPIDENKFKARCQQLKAITKAECLATTVSPQLATTTNPQQPGNASFVFG
jgi:hypothetical protein